MSKFNVGDRVRVSDSANAFKGFQGEIIAIDPEHTHPYLLNVYLDGRGRKVPTLRRLFEEEELELLYPGETVNEWERRRCDLNWPTPNAMRSAAEALDRLSPAKYGDILRFVADLCDEEVVSKRYDRTASLEDTLEWIDEELRNTDRKTPEYTQLLRSKGSIIVALMEHE